jgi:creatinine amidohydrolase/Fe(II)-dependent formamide hydrolase-like protein
LKSVAVAVADARLGDAVGATAEAGEAWAVAMATRRLAESAREERRTERRETVMEGRRK